MQAFGQAINSETRGTPRYTAKAVAIALVSLTKPVAVAMIMLVTGVGFVLATKVDAPATGFTGGTAAWPMLIWTCLLVGLSSAGAFALNQFHERKTDALMKRSSGRALPMGRLPAMAALVFGLGLFLLPLVPLFFWSSPLCAWATFLCGALYVWAYTPLKRMSSMSTFVGAIPGALLPVMGWLALRSDLDVRILFPSALLFLWQIPHAIVIAIRHFEDYQRAGMKQLPLVIGKQKSLLQLVMSTLLTGVLSFSPLAMLAHPLMYALLTAAISGVMFFFAWRVIQNSDPAGRSLGQFFGAHLIALPMQLVVFLVCLG